MIAETIAQAGQRLSRTSSSILSTRPEDAAGDAAQSQRTSKRPKLPGGKKAIAAFVISLFAFTVQTEAAQYVQQTLGYRKPFLSLYLGHSSFVFLFPLYMLFLRLFKSSTPLSHQFHLIAMNLHWQLSAPTASLPRPGPDSIRRRLSSLSMRSDAAYADEDDFGAEDFDIDTLEQRRTKPPPARRTWSERRFGFHIPKLLGVFGVLTFGITVPALSWYCAVPLTTMADITTIYNTYAVWALVFSIWFLGERWERRKVFSVLLACGGVVLVAYGGAEHRRRPREPETVLSGILDERKATDWVQEQIRSFSGRKIVSSTVDLGNAMLGDLLAFFGAVTMAAYEMAFKIVGTLPDEEEQRERFRGDSRRERRFVVAQGDDDNDSLLHGHDPESATLLQNEAYDAIMSSAEYSGQKKRSMDGPPSGAAGQNASSDQQEADAVQGDSERTAIWKPWESEGSNGRTASPSYQSVTPTANESNGDGHDVKHPSIVEAAEEAVRRRFSSERPTADDLAKSVQDWIPPPMPFGLHPLIMTSGIGLMTACTLWVGLPIAHSLGWETFELPSNWKTFAYLFLVAFSGIIFNGCFSILLALWGPVLASVSCLLTTVLVFVADIALGHDFRWISLLGCISIVAGFGVLATGQDESSE